MGVGEREDESVSCDIESHLYHISTPDLLQNNSISHSGAFLK